MQRGHWLLTQCLLLLLATTTSWYTHSICHSDRAGQVDLLLTYGPFMPILKMFSSYNAVMYPKLPTYLSRSGKVQPCHWFLTQCPFAVRVGARERANEWISEWTNEPQRSACRWLLYRPMQHVLFMPSTHMSGHVRQVQSENDVFEYVSLSDWPCVISRQNLIYPWVTHFIWMVHISMAMILLQYVAMLEQDMLICSWLMALLY